jgi:hypothetical protein
MNDIAETKKELVKPLNWKYFIDLFDLINLYQQGRLDPFHLGHAVVSRIKDMNSLCEEFVANDEFNRILNNFESIQDVDHFDGILNDLYDWGDEDKRLFIKTYPDA